jgi:DNA-binding response OmpR family regulator
MARVFALKSELDAWIRSRSTNPPSMTEVSRGIGAFAYRFGEHKLDCRTLELRKSGRKIKPAPQPARVLKLLVSRPGKLVSGDEIRCELWGQEVIRLAPLVEMQTHLHV